MASPSLQSKITVEKIVSLRERVLSGGEATRAEALELIRIPLNDKTLLTSLIDSASLVTAKFASKTAGLCALINAKSGACEEDCKFCAQSAHYQAGVETYPMLDAETVLAKAREAEKWGVPHFCLVTAQKTLKDKSFEKILELFRTVKSNTRLELDASIGLLDNEQARRLHEVGVSMVNHNLEASERFFPEICTTHSYEARKETIRNVKKHGMKICSGGILGMGETQEDRIDLIFTLKELDVDVVPINILNPRPGTPLEGAERIGPMEVIKTIAVYRFVMPDRTIKLCGGREMNLGDEWQPLALRAGANGMIVGGYLTTAGEAPEKDFAMLEAAGYQMPQSATRR